MTERLKQLQNERPLIAPSLLAADFTNLATALELVQDADALHLDIMDGNFVPNISYGPSIVQQLRPLWKRVFDVHLMVDCPEDWVAPFAKAGADIIVFHQESTRHAHRLIQDIKSKGCLVGVSLNPGTPICSIEPLIPFIDQILLMTVNPGFGGQSYIYEVEHKIQEARSLIQKANRPILLQVDGGVNLETIGTAAKAGADFFVAGTSVFKAENPRAEIHKLKNIAKEYL